jgi:hypothetical protein
MCAKFRDCIRNQVIEENTILNLLPSQDVQAHTTLRKHQSPLLTNYNHVCAINKIKKILLNNFTTVTS